MPKISLKRVFLRYVTSFQQASIAKQLVCIGLASLVGGVVYSLILLGSSAQPADIFLSDWHQPDWKYRQKLTLSSTTNQNGVVHIDIPSPYSPSTKIFSYSANGLDLAITDNNGDSLSYKVENWSSFHKKGRLAVQVTPSSREIHLYAGKTTAVQSQFMGNNGTSLSGTGFSDWSVVKRESDHLYAVQVPWLDTWTTALPSARIGPTVILPSGKIIGATVDSGEVVESIDQGKTWIKISEIKIDERLTQWSKKPIARFILRSSRGSLFVSFDGYPYLLRSTNEGISWSNVLLLDDNTTSGCQNIANTLEKSSILSVRSMDEIAPGTLIAGRYSQGSGPCAAIYLSYDDGVTWEKVNNDKAIDKPWLSRHVHVVANDPYNPTNLYAALGDGVLQQKIIKSNQSGKTGSWIVLKDRLSLISGVPDTWYWQPTTIEFDKNCRLFGGDYEFDPVIHRQCGENNDFHVVFRPKNQAGYYYWSFTDTGQNHFFGFLAHPGNAVHADKPGKSSGFIAIAPPNQDGVSGDYWQLHYIDTYTHPFTEGFNNRGGAFGASNVVNNKSLITTAEGKPFWLEIGERHQKEGMQVKPSISIEKTLSQFEPDSTIVVEYTFAVKRNNGYLPAGTGLDNIDVPVPLISVVDAGGKKAAEVVLKPDFTLSADNGRSVAPIDYPFFLNTFYKIQYVLDLKDKVWHVCLPQFNSYCTSRNAFSENFGIPTKLTLSTGKDVEITVLDVDVYQNATNAELTWLGEDVYPDAHPPTSSTAPLPQTEFKGWHDGNWGTQPVGSCKIIGWACDAKNTNKSLAVRIKVDGKTVETIQASEVRKAGVGEACGGNSNHGFSYSLPSSYHDGKPHKIEAYGVVGNEEKLIPTANWGAARSRSLVCTQTIPPSTPAPVMSPPPSAPPLIKGYHDGNWNRQAVTNCKLVGWACDVNNPNQALSIKVVIDDRPVTTVKASKPRGVGVQQICGNNANHGYTYTLPETYHDGKPHRIDVYAVINGKQQLIPRADWAKPWEIICTP